jgi:hypothetical protein
MTGACVECEMPAPHGLTEISFCTLGIREARAGVYFMYFLMLSLTHIFVTQGARRRSLFITGSVSSHASHRELVFLTKFGSSGVPSLACTLIRRSQHNWNAPSSQQASNEFAQTKLHCSASANARRSLNKHIFGGAVASISLLLLFPFKTRSTSVYLLHSARYWSSCRCLNAKKAKLLENWGWNLKEP